MKKIFNVLLAGLVLACFVSCKTDDEGGSGEPTRKKVIAPAAQGKIVLYSGYDDTTGVEYPTLQAAWAAIPGSSSQFYTIELGEGTYNLGTGQLSYSGTASIRIKGPELVSTANGKVKNNYGLGCMIKSSMVNLDGKKDGKLRCLISVQGSASLFLDNVTLQQSTLTSYQLECIGYDGAGVVAGYNCSFLSHQDTMRTTGKAWFYKCYIEGDVDFLWMETKGKVALYEKCILCAVSDRTNRSYLTAPRSDVNATKIYKGLVVYNSEIWVDGIETYLGRNPWTNAEYFSKYYNNVAFVGTKCTKGNINNAFYSKCNRTSNVFFTGFNVDSTFRNAAESENLSASQIATEYSSRDKILNRCYDTSSGSIVDDISKLDTEELAIDLRWYEVDIGEYYLGFTESDSGKWFDTKAEFDEYVNLYGLVKETDYINDGNMCIFKLTDAGNTKFEAMSEQVYTVKYGEEVLQTNWSCVQFKAAALASDISDSEYTIDQENKIIKVLTESAYNKVKNL